MSEINLDEILKKVGGFGRFQKQYYVYLCCVVIFSVVPLTYIFTSRDIKYRCFIEECEQETQDKYNAPWVKNAVPFKDGIPQRCNRYIAETNNTCLHFKNETEKCDKFVFERKETTIVHDFGIQCDENLWKLTFVGTVNVFGELVCLPISGFFSDRFGRKTMLITSLFLTSLIGIIKSFSVSYLMFIILEFLNTTFGSGNYSGAFILAIELVGPKGRNITNTFLSCAFAFGQMLLGLTAWLSPTWRIFLRIFYGPGFLLVLCCQIAPESIRWLISVGQKDKARTILEKIAKYNGNEIPHGEIDKLLDKSRIGDAKKEPQSKGSFIKTIRRLPMFIRAIHCSYTWICCTFVYYGLTIHSVSISDNIYQSFIITVAVELPAYILTYFIIDRLGRKWVLSSTLITAGVACVLTSYTQGIPWASTCCFLLGKLCMTTAYTVLYIFTTEMFPTCSRHSMFALCSMFGRLGSMVAPQIPLLARISKALPLIMFGVMAISSGVLALFFPETLGTKLPDTIDDAINIGKKTENVSIHTEELSPLNAMVDKS